MRNIVRVLTVALAAVLVTIVPASGAGQSPKWLTTPCQQEDSTNCYWDASKSGNGVGHSYYAVKVGHKTCVLYWGDRYAKRHNYCER